MKKNYVTAAFALLLLAGCSNDVKESDIKFSGEAGAKVSFSAVINDQEASNLVTRATETSWESGDRVGITCGKDQMNVEYQYSPDNTGLFNAVNGKLKIFGCLVPKLMMYWHITPLLEHLVQNR